MGNRLDTELRQITESITLLKESHENNNNSSSQESPGARKSTPKGKVGLKKPLVIKDSLEMPGSIENI